MPSKRPRGLRWLYLRRGDNPAESAIAASETASFAMSPCNVTTASHQLVPPPLLEACEVRLAAILFT